MDRMSSEFFPILTYTKTSTLPTLQSLRESRRQSRKSRNNSRIAQIIQRLVDGDFKSQEEIVQQCRGIGRAQFYMVAERRSAARRCGNPLCAQIQISSKGIFCSGKCAYVLSGYARYIGDNDERGINSGKSKPRKSKSSITAPSYMQECNKNILIEDVFPFAKLHATEELDTFLPQLPQYYKKQRHHRRNTSKELLLAERSDKKYTIKIDAIHHLIEDNQSLIRADRSDDSSTAFEIMNLVRRNSEKFCKQRIKQELSKIQIVDEQNAQNQQDLSSFDRDLINAQRSDMQKLNSKNSDDFKNFERDLVHAQRSNELMKEVSDLKINQGVQQSQQDVFKFDGDLINAQRSDMQKLNSKNSDEFKKFERDLVHAQRSENQVQKNFSLNKIRQESAKFENDLVHAQRSDEKSNLILKSNSSQNFDRDLVNAQRSDQEKQTILNSKVSDDFKKFDRDLINAERSDKQQLQVLNSKISDDFKKVEHDLINAQRSNEQIKEILNLKIDQDLKINQDLQNFERDLVHAQRSNLNLNDEDSSSSNFERDLVHAQRSDNQQKQVDDSDQQKFDRDLINAKRSDQNNLNFENSNSNLEQINDSSKVLQDYTHAIFFRCGDKHKNCAQSLNSNMCVCGQQTNTYLNFENVNQSCNAYKNVLQNFVTNSISNKNFEQISNLFVEKTSNQLDCADRSDQSCVKLESQNYNLNIEESDQNSNNLIPKSDFDRDLIQARRSDNQLEKGVANNDFQILHSDSSLSEFNRDLISASRSDDSNATQIENNDDQISNSNEFDRDLISASRSDDSNIQQILNNNDQNLSSDNFDRDLISASRSDDSKDFKRENNSDDKSSNSVEFNRDLISASRSDDCKLPQTENNNNDQDLNSVEFLDRDLISASRSDNLVSNSFEKATMENSDLLNFDKDLINAKRSDNQEMHQIINNDMHESISLNFGQDLIQTSKSDNQELEQIQNSNSLEFDQDLINAERSDKFCQHLNVENIESQQSIVQHVIPPNDLINAVRSDDQKQKQNIDQESSQIFENDLISASRSDKNCQQLESINEHIEHVEHIDNDFVNAQRSDDQSSQIQEIQNKLNFERDLISAERSDKSFSNSQPQFENSKNSDNFDRDLINAKRSDDQICSELIQSQNSHIVHVEHVNALDDNINIEHVEHTNTINNEKLPNIPKLELDNKSNSRIGNLVSADRSDQSCLKLNSVNQQIQSSGVNVLFDDDLTDTSSAYSDDDDVLVEGQNTNVVTRITLNANKQNDDVEDQDEFLLNDLIFAQRSDKQSQKNHKLIKNNNENDFVDVKKSNLGIEIDENLKNLQNEGDMSKKEKLNFMSLMESAFEFSNNDSKNSNIQINNLSKQKQSLNLDLSSTRDAKIFEENSKNIDKLNNKNVSNAQNVQNVQNVPYMLNQGIDIDENSLMSRCQSLPPCDYMKSPRNLQHGILKKSLSGNYTSLRRKQKVTFGLPQTFYLPPSAEEAPLRMSKRQTPINSKFLEDDNVKKFDQFLQKQQRKITCKVTTEEKNLQDELLKAFKRGCEESDEEEEICSSPQKKENNNNNNNNTNSSSLFGELQKSLKIRDDEDDCLSSDDEDLDDFMSSDQRQKQGSDSDGDSDSDSDCEEWHVPLFQAKGGPQVEMSMYAKMQTFFGECITHNSREWLSSAAANGTRGQIAKETVCDCSQLAIRNAFQLMMNGRLDEIMTDLDIKCSKEEIENNLTQLIKTMRFRKPVPGQGTPVWNFVLIGLLMALSLNQLKQLQPLFCKDGQYQLLTDYVTENGDGMDIQQFMQLKQRFVLHTSAANQ